MPPRAPLLLASDLDGTLIPPTGPDAAHMHAFLDLIASTQITLAYLTGRHLDLALDGVAECGLPQPRALACDVGTTLYWRTEQGAFEPDTAYRQRVADMDGVVPADAVVRALAGVPGLTLQEADKQSDFKVSFYVDDSAIDVGTNVGEHLKDVGNARLVFSHDPADGRGLLDVVPAGVGKQTALVHLAEVLETDLGDVIYAGDSGNDSDAILSGCRAVIVGNAPEGLKRDLRESAARSGRKSLVYFAAAGFVGGVLEGVRHFTGS